MDFHVKYFTRMSVHPYIWITRYFLALAEEQRCHFNLHFIPLFYLLEFTLIHALYDYRLAGGVVNPVVLGILICTREKLPALVRRGTSSFASFLVSTEILQYHRCKGSSPEFFTPILGPWGYPDCSHLLRVSTKRIPWILTPLLLIHGTVLDIIQSFTKLRDH